MNRLTDLNIGTFIDHGGENGYGDEEALVVAQSLPNLDSFAIFSSNLGREGVAIVSNSLKVLGTVQVRSNNYIQQSCGLLGKLRRLKWLDACMHSDMQY